MPQHAGDRGIVKAVAIVPDSQPQLRVNTAQKYQGIIGKWQLV